MRRCVCGNDLPNPPRGFDVIQGPCRCEIPGPYRHATLTGPTTLPDGEYGGVSERQYDERTRLGLPPVTDLERSFAREMDG